MAETTEEKQEQKSPDIFHLIKEYLSTKAELTRLTVIERVTVVSSSLITDAFVAVTGVLTFLFASFTLALWIGESTGSYAIGFGVVTLIYLALALIVFFSKERLVDGYLNDFLVKRMFKRKK
ncbi:phage holin family protein [Desertivirga xinjiangensis]|uniref:phage holin family protein n=1 Tax=Desertivirga xinjiangensis TaxID=539206 RepID=UPI00210E6344|nr:phage holin family protein [Pedobacter xinjiangensis]